MVSRFNLPVLEEMRRQVLSKTEDDITIEVDNFLQEILQNIDDVQKPMPDPQAIMEQISTLIDDLSTEVDIHDVGTVQHIGNRVANLSGFQNVRTDDLVTFPTGVQGLVLDLESESVNVILLGTDEGIRGGDLVTSTGKRLTVPVGPQLLGRVVNPLGEPLDGQPPFSAVDHYVLEREAPSIIDRSPVNQPLQTGLKIIDALLPIGRGQRELIVGNRQSGKTSLALDTILNQIDTEVDCIYVAIGQKKSSTISVIETLKKYGAMKYTTVVLSSSDDPPSLRYLAPYTATSIAEYLLHQGRDVLIVYDDLSKHADAYRELSLLLRRPPGREAYPGDIFYQHSRLLERACKLSEAKGGGSLTALPIVTIQQGNVAAYIPTNLISITDGQIILDSNLFNKGIKPAVDVGRSVSRVGGAAQTKAMRNVSGDIRLQLAQFEEVSRFARFGTEVDSLTTAQIARGERLQRNLIQTVNQPMHVLDQIVILFAATEGYLSNIELDEIPEFEKALLGHLHKNSLLFSRLESDDDFSVETQQELREEIQQFIELWTEGTG